MLTSTWCVGRIVRDVRGSDARKRGQVDLVKAGMEVVDRVRGAIVRKHEQVVSRAADQRVVAKAARQDVVAGPGIETVGDIVAQKDVVAAAGLTVFDDRYCRRCRYCRTGNAGVAGPAVIDRIPGRLRKN